MEKTGDTQTYLDGVITVTRRWDDYHACITGHPAYWGCGKTPQAAIDDVMKTHGEDIAEFARTGNHETLAAQEYKR